MMRKVSSFLRGWGWIRGQGGFTLAEVLIALVITGVLIIGSFEIVRHMVVTSSTDRDKANALVQVQYVGFWISEDVMQARPDGITLGGGQGFPLTISWTEWDGDMNQITYSVEGELWKLSRHHVFTPKGGPAIDKGTSVVGEFLDPTGTRCEWVTEEVPGGNVTAVLRLSVSANVDGQVASRIYEINPRSR